jgi:hypothetical protein
VKDRGSSAGYVTRPTNIHDVRIEGVNSSGTWYEALRGKLVGTRAAWNVTEGR